MSTFRSYYYFIGRLFIALSIALITPEFVAFIYNEETGLTFLGVSLLALSLGLPSLRIKDFGKLTKRDAMIITAISWILVSILGGIPYMLSLKKSFIDSFFEATSGFTTTGITVFTGLNHMPRCVLFWRALTQWLGGLGILTFFLTITYEKGSAVSSLFSAEAHKIGGGRPTPSIFRTLEILWAIYIAFTLGGFLILLLLGLSPFDAITHVFTCFSTGGFSNYDESIAYFALKGFKHARLIEYVFSVFMLMGGINFLIHYRVIKGDWRAAYKDFEIRIFWMLIAASVAVIMINHLLFFPRELSPKGLENTFRETLFQVSSLITSTGYVTTDINSRFFPQTSKMIIVILMFIGGCVGSTAGGIKVLRIGILWKVVTRELKRINLPKKTVLPVVVEGMKIPEDEIYRVTAITISWIGIVFLGAVLVTLFSDLTAWQALSGILSALSNMGPFFFSVEKMASLGAPVKLLFIWAMLAGRLELIPLYILLTKRR